MTSLRLPTSDVIDCGIELHQGFQATTVPVDSKAKTFAHPLFNCWFFILGDEMFTAGLIATYSPHANTVQHRKETYILQM